MVAFEIGVHPTDSFWPLVRFLPIVNFIYEEALLFSDKFVIWQMEWRA